MSDVQSLVTEFVHKLRTRKIEGSHASARQTAELLLSLVSQQRLPFTNQSAILIDAVRTAGEQLIAANPVELHVGNIVRRVLQTIREKDLSSTTNAIGGLSLNSNDENENEHVDHPGLSTSALAAVAGSKNTLCAPSLLEDLPNIVAPQTDSSGGDSEGNSKFEADEGLRSKNLKEDVIKATNELIQDIDTCREKISKQAVEHIHPNAVILTYGGSRTIKEFLCATKDNERPFRVLVAEGAPRYQGHVLAKELAAEGLKTTVITDSEVFAIISTVNKMIVGAHAIMADGAVIAPVGINMVAVAADHHAVPFVVVAGNNKLCPLHTHSRDVLLNELRSPSELLDFGSFSDCMNHGSIGGSPHLLNVINPAFDYIPPNLVSHFITDEGGHSPLEMRQLISKCYSSFDLVVQR